MLKGVIFDADGTLLDSMHVWCELGRKYLKKHGIEAEEGLDDILYPMSLEESSRYLKERYRLTDTEERICDEIIETIRYFYLNEVKLKNGAFEFIKYLNEQNIPLAVASSNDKELLHGAFVRLGIIDSFKGVFTCNEPNENKHEPMVYLRAARAIGAKPTEIAVFEDTLYGIQTAKAAGFVTVAVDDESNRRETKQLDDVADHFICDFTAPILITAAKGFKNENESCTDYCGE